MVAPRSETGRSEPRAMGGGRSETGKSDHRATTVDGGHTENASTNQLAEAARSKQKLTVALWENSIGPTWPKYHKYIQVLPWVVYKDKKIEAKYSQYVKETYTFRNALCGFVSILVLLPIWIAPSIMMRKDLDSNGLNGLLNCYSPLYRTLYDLIMGISVLASLILMFSNNIETLRRNPEETFYAISLIPFTLLTIWELGVLVTGRLNKHEFTFGGKQSVDGAMQFKFWTDLLTLVLMFMLIVFLDLLQNTRTIYTIYTHFFIMIVYSGLRIFIMIIFKDPTHDKWIPAVVVTQLLQVIFYTALCFIGYLSRQQKELSERAAYLDIMFDQERLQELRKNQAKKRNKGQTLQEKLIDVIKKAQTGLQVAAFERSTQGEVVLLERDEVLRQACEIAMDAEDLFTVGQATAGGGDDDDDEGGGNVLNIYGKRGGGGKGGGGGGGVERKTGEDKLNVAFDQQEFFTNDILPNFSVQSEIKKNAGQANSGALKILDVAERDPHLLVKVALTLIEPVEDDLNVTPALLSKYFYQIERRYHPNPYHNAVHGAMVGHMSIAILRTLGVYDQMDKHQLLSLVIASIGHDVGHPGINNNYFVNSQSMLARMYNDNAVLENYHSFLTFRFAQVSSEVNIFQNLSAEDWREIRQNIIEFILITDMSQHFAIISKFRVRRTSDKFDLKGNIEDQQLVAKLCIKMADLSHSSVDWPQHLEWSFRVTKEFYHQGDLEKAGKLPVSPLCDSNTHPDFAKSQAGFLQFVVTPLAAELAEIDATGIFNNDLLNKLLFNKHKWELMREKRDEVPIPAAIDAMETAPPLFAEASLFLALRAKTVDDINSNPMEKIDILEMLGQSKAVGLENEGAEPTGDAADAKSGSGSGSGSGSSSSGSSSGDSSSGSGSDSDSDSGSSSGSGSDSDSDSDSDSSDSD